MARRPFSFGAVVFAVVLAWPAQAQTFKVDKWNIGGEGGTDCLAAEPGIGRVFVSRSSHVMVVDGPDRSEDPAVRDRAASADRPVPGAGGG